MWKKMNEDTQKKREKVISIVPDSISAKWIMLRQSVAHAQAWSDLAHIYAGHGLPWQAGYAARQALRLDAALGPGLQVLGMGAWQAAAAGDALLGRSVLSEAALLVEQFEAQLKECPGDWLTWLYLARLQEILVIQGAAPEPGQASDGLLPPQYALQQAQMLEPLVGESLHWMGAWRLNAGDSQGSVAALRELLDIRPMRFGSMMYLAEALLGLGQLTAAEKAFARAALSNNPDFLLTLSGKMFTYNYWQEAQVVLLKAMALKPDSVAITLALAKICWEVYELSKAREFCQRVLILESTNKEAIFMLAGLPGRMGDARSHFEKVQAEYIARADPMSRLASSVAMVALYQDVMPPFEVADLHRRLCAPIEAGITQKKDFHNARVVNRRLRIGWVTGDLHRQHPVNIFMLPMLQRFDHASFDICVYYVGAMHDKYTRLAKDCVDCWREVAGLDDAALQQVIVADKIDILIDLAGHTQNHRLGLFAMRAAPVQATFLGYPHSTGLSSIDWLIGDATVCPDEDLHLYSEGLAHLPNSVFCWAPIEEYPLPSPRPAQASVVFGSFNNVMKLSPQTIALWARILLKVPDALLLLKAPSLRDAEVQTRFVDLFAAHGIVRERLLLRGPSGLAEMMQEYGDIDIALDPTPYNGGTTTLQALWMGVPVVTLAGGGFVSRMGASFMKTLRRSDWVASSEDGYVAAAVGLASSRAILRCSRAYLREQMMNSPLCDIATYVAHFEALLRCMWGAHCEGDAQRVIHVVDEKV